MDLEQTVIEIIKWGCAGLCILEIIGVIMIYFGLKNAPTINPRNPKDKGD